TPIREESYGRPSSAGGLAGVVGFARPVALVRGYTPVTWARAFLRASGAPRSACNIGAVLAWEGAEGGHWGNPARYNPLNTARDLRGSSLMPGPNPAGVRAYRSWDQGLRATVATLHNGHYGAVLAALRAGNDAQAVADAVAASPWGTRPFGA